ncbi:MAG: hypothetical protein KDD48_08790 [Bdellovibrionales bacterium]|nr:hypothetical protein [Bdellovibrionales bacterium]
MFQIVLKLVGIAIACMLLINCREDKIARHALIQDLPVGYEEENVNPQSILGTSIEKSSLEVSYNAQYDAEPSVSDDQETMPKDHVRAIDQDVELRLWNFQPRTFVHFGNEESGQSN